MATTKSISRKRGDTYPIPVTIKKNKVAVDITGYTLTLSVTNTAEPAAADYLFQSTGVIDSAIDGTAHFELLPADVATAGSYYYDIEITDAAGYKHTPLEGPFVLTQDRTK